MVVQNGIQFRTGYENIQQGNDLHPRYRNWASHIGHSHLCSNDKETIRKQQKLSIMKTKMFFLAIIVIAFLTSCSPENKFIGAWMQEGSVSRYTFRDNGTYEIFSTEYNTVQLEGSWSIEENGSILVTEFYCGSSPQTHDYKWEVTWNGDGKFTTECIEAGTSCSGMVGQVFIYNKM